MKPFHNHKVWANRVYLVLALAISGRASVNAQTPAPANFTPAPPVITDALVRDLRWRNVGNANLRGRISSIDALDSDWTHVVAGTAMGGVFKSVNGGVSWIPIFDRYGSSSIGDVAIYQKDPSIIWVGTGEECGRNSATWGDGIYKSTDGGRTFTRMGLENTYNIGQILLHPDNPNIVYVAAIGNIYSNVGDRGFFKTVDGGKTWTKLASILPNDGWTGAIDAVMDPRNPNTVYVSFWERKRFPWALVSGGKNGGIFKSNNGGQSFTKLEKGLPPGETGKIGLAIARSNPRVLMAHVEHGFQPGGNSPDAADMTKLGAGIYRSEDAGASWTFMNRNLSRPFYYNHVAISPTNDKRTYHFNQNFQVSDDGGRTMRGGGGGNGHCWHALWVDPHNANRYWVGSDDGLALTHDDGRSAMKMDNINATQYYDIAFDMRDPYFIYGGLQDAGSSGGPSMTRAAGIYTSDWFNLSGGDGYHAEVDPTDWRWVYTESQPDQNGGNVGRSNVETRERVSIRPNRASNILNYEQYITPEIEQRQQANNWGGMGAFRYNWSTPFELSPQNPSTIYLGANHLFMSTDRGTTWTIISPDLSKNEPHKTIRRSGGMTPDENPGGGAEYHATIVTISPSPLDASVIWVGTDDGNVQVTRNRGVSWTNVIDRLPGLPQRDIWVSRVEASNHQVGTAYVTLDGHRFAIYTPFVFKTTDFGQTWTNISSNLPVGNPLYVVKEDLRNPGLLFAGGEFGVYYTVNGGGSWAKLNNNMPTVNYQALEIHPRDGDLMAATMGRGLWVMDNITPLQQFTAQVQSAEAHLFSPRPATRWLNIQSHGTGGSLGFQGQNPTRDAMIDYHLGAAVTGNVTVEIADVTGVRKRTFTRPAQAGISRMCWNFAFDPDPNAPAGGRGAAGGGAGARGGGGGGAGAGAGAGRGGAGGAGGGAAGAAAGGAAGAGAAGGRGGAGAAGGGGRGGAAGAGAQAGGECGGGGGGGRGGGGGGGRGGGGGGGAAGPGEYRVTLTANGKSYTQRLVVRDDPIRLERAGR